MGNYIPKGWHTVTPRLVVPDAAKEVDFLQQAFAGVGEYLEDRPTEIRIGDSLLMISEVGVRDVMPGFFYLYVEDVDSTYERAVKAGGESLEAPQEMHYGDRRAMIQDPGGNIWQIATHNEEAFQAFMREHAGD
jgi:PhnB protein